MKNPSDAAAIRDAHMQDLSFQQAATEFGTGTAGDDESSAGVRSGASDQGSSGGSSGLRRSGDKTSSKSGSSTGNLPSSGSNKGSTSASWRGGVGSSEGIATGRTSKAPTSKVCYTLLLFSQ